MNFGTSKLCIRNLWSSSMVELGAPYIFKAEDRLSIRGIEFQEGGETGVRIAEKETEDGGQCPPWHVPKRSLRIRDPQPVVGSSCALQEASRIAKWVMGARTHMPIMFQFYSDIWYFERCYAETTQWGDDWRNWHSFAWQSESESGSLACALAVARDESPTNTRSEETSSVRGACRESGGAHHFALWWFPKIVISQSGWFIQPHKIEWFGGIII